MNKFDEKIAIIGGGISGLVIAEGLQKKGYKNITVFEKEDRIGGKLDTIWYQGKAYELGALFGLPSHRHLKALLKTFNIKVDGPKLSRVNYDINGIKIMQIPKAELNHFADELDRLPDVLAEYESLEKDNICKVESPLMLPFAQWCDMNGFRILKTVYIHYFTSYGLGYIEDVPALYVLKTLTYDNLMSFMAFPEFFTWKEGVSSLIHSLQQEIKDIRLAQCVKKISLSKHKKLYIHTEFEILEFHRVIITAPFNQFSNIYEEDDEMKEFLSAIKYQAFNVYAFIAEKIPEGCGCILENLDKEKKGHIVVWNSRWRPTKGEELVVVYAYDNPGNSKGDSFKVIENDLIRLGIQNPRLYRFKQWQHAPYVETEILKKGFYEKMAAMQGQNNIFFAGEIMSTVTMDNCIQHATYLMNKYF